MNEKKIIVSGKDNIGMDFSKMPISNRVLIISQYNMIPEIIHFVDQARTNLEYEFVIKTHPRGIDEYNKYRRAFSDCMNVVIHRDTEILEEIQYAKYIIGIYSSALIDALSYNNRYIFTIAHELHDVFNDLIKYGFILTVNNFEDAITKSVNIKENDMNIYQSFKSKEIEKHLHV